MVPSKGNRVNGPGILKRMARHWRLYLLILPAIVTVFIFHYVPIYGVQFAFCNYRPSRGIWGSDWVGLEHFIRFFTYPGFLTIIRRIHGSSRYLSPAEFEFRNGYSHFG